MSCSNVTIDFSSPCCEVVGPTIVAVHVNSVRARELYESGMFPQRFGYTEGNGGQIGWGYVEMSNGWVHGYDAPQPGYNDAEFKAQLYATIEMALRPMGDVEAELIARGYPCRPFPWPSTP